MRLLRLLNEAGFPQDKAQGQDAEHLHMLSRLQEAPRPIFHRFGGDTNFVKKALPFGALFSLHEDSFRKKSTAAAIPHIPQERVFFETDADESFLDPDELVEGLENRLESVRLAYAKCRE